MTSWSAAASFSLLLSGSFISFRNAAGALAAVTQQFSSGKRSFSLGCKNSGRSWGCGSGRSVLSTSTIQGQNSQ